MEDAKAVTELDLSNNSFDHRNANPGLNIKDISDIKYFSSLERLNLSYNSLTDLSFLSQVTSLTELELTGVQADDFTPLKTLINIDYITIQWIYDPDNGYYGLESLDVFADMKGLEAIDMKVMRRERHLCPWFFAEVMECIFSEKPDYGHKSSCQFEGFART